MRLKRHQVVTQPDGFAVIINQTPAWSIRWDEIIRVVAFKLDRWSTDTICFGFQRNGETDRVWCIEEDWDGYKQVVPGIEELTQGGWPDKFARVAKPAFEFNWTLIWEVSDAHQLQDDPCLIWHSAPDAIDPTE